MRNHVLAVPQSVHEYSLSTASVTEKGSGLGTEAASCAAARAAPPALSSLSGAHARGAAAAPTSAAGLAMEMVMAPPLPALSPGGAVGAASSRSRCFE